MERTGNREMSAGAGDALARAFELIATPALFGLGGWLVDGRAGTFPLVTLIAAGVVLGYQVWRLVREYRVDMERALDLRRAGYAPTGPSAADSPGAGSGSWIEP